MYQYIIVDDERLIREGTIKKLSDMNDIVTCIGEAENGEEAIQLIKTLHPDIVILDMQMPVMDGNELLTYLAKHYPDIALIAISGYRNFDYIKNAVTAKVIDYILKPFSRQDIQRVMGEAIGKIEDKIFFQNLLSNEEQIESAYLEHDIHSLQNVILGYQKNAITLNSAKLSFINNTHNLILLTLFFPFKFSPEEIQAFLDENGFGDLALFLPHLNNSQLGFVFLFIPEQTVINHNRLTLQISTALADWFHQQDRTVTIGISNTHSSLLDSHSAFLETVQALNRQPVLVNNNFYYFYNPDEPQHYINWDRQEEFLFRIESGMTEEVTALTDLLFEHYKTLPGFTLSDVKYHCYHMTSHCRNIMNFYVNQISETNDSSSMQNVINNIFSMEDLKQYYLQFFLNISAMLKTRSVYAVDDTITKVKIYIERNYQKNLTQEFISYLFYLNRSYLSYLFKERTGEKFINYLNQVRIQKSKELLKDPERKLYQIAKAVGYDNVKYFFRVFKKYTNMTPEQYRLTVQKPGS